MQVVITMAGAGSRFRNAGYDIPKFQIKARGRSLFSWSLTSLEDFIENRACFAFVCRKEDNAGPFIARECESLDIRDFEVIELDTPTDGQATTVLHARPPSSEPIAVYNIDTYVDPRFLKVSEIRGDGWIPCFPGEGDAWSFVRTEEDGRALEVREKKRISPHATVGLYWFGSFDLYRAVYERYYGAGQNLEKGERYIAPMYNQLIADGRAVYIHELPVGAVRPLGTPEDVAVF